MQDTNNHLSLEWPSRIVSHAKVLACETLLCVLKNLSKKLTLICIFNITSAIFVMLKTTSFWSVLQTPLKTLTRALPLDSTAVRLPFLRPHVCGVQNIP